MKANTARTDGVCVCTIDAVEGDENDTGMMGAPFAPERRRICNS